MADPYAKSRTGSLSDAFWSGLDAGRFLVQRCGDCGSHRFPPLSMCPVCHSIAYTWDPVSGAATLWTWTVVHRAPKPEWEGKVPYCLGVVRLAEGPLVLARIDTGQPGGAGADIGMALQLVIDPGGPDGPSRYHFAATGEPAPGGPGSAPS